MIERSIPVATWYGILTLLFVGYTLFCTMQYRYYRDRGAIYSAILFASVALGTFCIAMARTQGPESIIPVSIWFNVQRGSYVGVLLGGWWLVDWRLSLRNGEGIQLRKLWRIWTVFFGGNDER